ncbi:hypothetical protein AT959_19945 [Dechloromonas denitrificans]|uniref:Uncharacterized protein n=1 Tax=Dechloromonas denitrificans TaxID=281362 RepID=A0A133XDS0_9RHOO|nr:hypothetical protein [Dechloromonas denitrificans]KXB29087.1 hypothetical protein AT959_19945 [Dechloromonas denitrificans]
MIFHVYSEPKPEGYFVNEPFGIYRTILDADWLLYLLLPLLLLIVVGLLMLAWRVHEIPAHKADHKKMRQAELVSALTLLGLLEHWVWAVALFLAYVDWQAFEDFMVNILRRSRTPAEADGKSIHVAPVEAASAEAASVPASQAIEERQA